MNPFNPILSLVNSYYQARDQFGNIPIQPTMYGDNNSFEMKRAVGSVQDENIERFRMIGGIKETFSNFGNKASTFLKDLDNTDVNNALKASPFALSMLKNTFDNAIIDDSIQAPKLQLDVNGQPIYNQKRFLDSNQEYREDIKGTVGRSLLRGGTSGAAAGAQIGGVPGAIIGSAIGLIGGAIGGSKRRKQLLKESMRRDELATEQNQRFNSASERFYRDEESQDYRSAVIGKKYLNL